MHINLLSEVTAYADGGTTDLLATLRPMPRLFVAVLALSPGRPVGMDRLAEQLWGGILPADPRGQMYGLAARARAALRGAGSGDARHDLLTTQASGYCLQVDAQSTDVGRFRVKAAEARARADSADAADAADAAEAAALARAALLEWGPEAGPYRPVPLTGLPGQWAADYRVTLRREHRDVVIGLLTAELRSGGAQRVLAEFAKLADTDAAAREDEELTALLMRAYYLCGRQSEAFKTYQRTIESLQRRGVEAGRELRMMEKRIRNQDPRLGYPQETVMATRDLSQAGEGTTEEGRSEDRDGDTAVPGGGAAGHTDPGSTGEQSPHSWVTYSQQNIGRTVVANQGTQHVDLGGSDE
jgi:DNA-binding SARP family transcriptional activator